MKDVADARGNTALHHAAEFGFHELGAYLVAKGADARRLNQARSVV